MNIKEFIKENHLCLDGAMGTLLQQSGLMPGESPELWNIKHPDIITDIHKKYFDAGANVVSTNTFGANILKFSEQELEKIINAAVENANKAKELSLSKKEKFIALDIGPCGKLLKPYGDLDFEDAVEVFAKTVRIGAKCGVDLIFLETFSDSYETKAALLAVKENCDLPVFLSNAYGADGKLMTGASPEIMVAMLEGMGADAIGANCSLGPDMLFDVVKRLTESASVPVILKPNAGLPEICDGKTIYNITPKHFAQKMGEFISSGIRIFGGCCGTTPEYIKELSEIAKTYDIKPLTQKRITRVTSHLDYADFGEKPILIGERINPTGKKRFKQALLENDIPYILGEGITQAELGADVLDVNVGIPDIDEKEMLTSVVKSLQTVTEKPLQLDTSNPSAMESALRIYNGKAMINSVNGKKESMDAIFPLVKKYGGVVVALTLDENGIPDTVDGRIEIAKKILDTAEKYGIDKNDVIFDTLTLAVSSDSNAPSITLGTLNRIRNELMCHTILGVSNISFGLPERDTINSAFFSLALTNGLSSAIMNPYSVEMMKTYKAYLALCGLDKNCLEYIEYISSREESKQEKTVTKPENKIDSLKKAIVSGMKQSAETFTKEYLANKTPLDIVNLDIIPALDTVGTAYEQKKAYLPQLLMSAEAAKAAFEIIKVYVSNSSDAKKADKKADFVIATVEGDIHDIGKNIVKLLLENYGFNVHDLGKDVKPEIILQKVLETKSKLLGLSALMTTTLSSMEKTITLVKEKAPFCKIVAGGAVLTEEYAKKIGADKYAKDAMETVRYAESVIE